MIDSCAEVAGLALALGKDAVVHSDPTGKIPKTWPARPETNDYPIRVKRQTRGTGPPELLCPWWYLGPQPQAKLGRHMSWADLTPKCLKTSVTGGPTIPIAITLHHHTARNVYSESTNLATVSTRILCSPTKQTWQHSPIILSSRTNPQQDETQCSQTAPQENQYMCPGQQQNFN